MIELRGVCLHKAARGGARALLTGVDLEVAPGEVVVIGGPVGSGKTTLLGLLYGQVIADSGRVRMFGHDVRRLRRSSIALLRRRLGIVPQTLQLLGERTALANVAVALEIRGQRPRDAQLKAAEALARVGLADAVDVAVSALSPGEAQRVALARAIAGDPALLILDEPTSHQDEAGRELLIELLADYPAVTVSRDPALIDAAGVHGWRTFELVAGELRAVGEGIPTGAAITSDHLDQVAGDIDADDLEIEIAFEDGGDVVPFPRRSVL